MVRYTDTAPYKNGHANPQRWVRNNQCVPCKREADARERAVPLAPGTWAVLRRKG